MPEVKDGEVVVLTLKLYYDLDRVTLSYDLNGGIFFKAHQYDDQTVRYGTKLTAEEAPFRSGFKFVGWNDGAKLYQAGDTIVMTAEMCIRDSPRSIQKQSKVRRLWIFRTRLINFRLSGKGISCSPICFCCRRNVSAHTPDILTRHSRLLEIFAVLPAV